MPRECDCELREKCDATPGSKECAERFTSLIDEIAEEEGMGIVQCPRVLAEPLVRLIELTTQHQN